MPKEPYHSVRQRCLDRLLTVGFDGAGPQSTGLKRALITYVREMVWGGDERLRILPRFPTECAIKLLVAPN